MCGAVDLCGCAGSVGAQYGRPAVPLPPAAQDDEEGTAEGLVEEGVEDGVQHGVDVAQPQTGCPQFFRHWVAYEGVHYIGDEERCPAEAETTHNDAQNLGRFSFCSHAVVSLILSRVTGSSGPLQYADLFGVCAGRGVDPLVGQHHKDEGDVEGHHRAGEGVWFVHHEDTSGVAAYNLAPFRNLAQIDYSKEKELNNHLKSSYVLPLNET